MNPGFRSTYSILQSLEESERTELQSRLNAPSNMIWDLAKALLNEDSLRSTVQHLSEDGLTVLRDWMTNKGQVNNAHAKNSRISAGIEELIDRGWIFENTYGPYRSTYIIPWDMMAGLIPLLFDIPWKRIRTSGPSRTSTVAPVWDPFWHDVFQVLSFARSEPLQLTNQHSIYKRQLTKLETMLWPSASVSSDVRLNTILHAMDSMGFFTTITTPLGLGINHDQVKRVFTLNPREQFYFLADYVFDPQRMAFPELFISLLASSLPDDTFLLVDRTQEYLTSLGLEGTRIPYHYSAARDDMMAWGFWIAPNSNLLGLTASTYAAMHHRFESVERGLIVIQSTGEVMVPPQVDMSERWELDGLASRVKSDRVSTYQIDASSVKRHIERGGTLKDHLETLTQISRKGVPENVQVNLSDWYRAIGRHRIMEVTVIHSERPEDSKDVQTLLGRDALARLSDTDIIIPQGRVKEILKRLDRSGTPILSQILTPSHPDLSGRQSPQEPSPRWTLHLGHHREPTPSAPPSKESLRRQLLQAQREGQPVTVVYNVPGVFDPHVEVLIPIQVEEHWIQAYAAEERRYILIEWSSIMEVH